MNNLSIYEKVRKVPEEAQKPITGGRLNGKTDISPMWRIKKLTEMFGVCGFGWKYKIIEKRLESGGNGEVAAFVDIELFVKIDGVWSDSIIGTGGSMFIANERSGIYTSDECFKMALTDAISVSCKSLGIGADVYWSADRTKYNYSDDKTKPAPSQSAPSQPASTSGKPATQAQKMALEKMVKMGRVNLSEDQIEGISFDEARRIFNGK